MKSNKKNDELLKLTKKMNNVNKQIIELSDFIYNTYEDVIINSDVNKLLPIWNKLLDLYELTNINEKHNKQYLDSILHICKKNEEHIKTISLKELKLNNADSNMFWINLNQLKLNKNPIHMFAVKNDNTHDFLKYTGKHYLNSYDEKININNYKKFLILKMI